MVLKNPSWNQYFSSDQIHAMQPTMIKINPIKISQRFLVRVGENPLLIHLINFTVSHINGLLQLVARQTLFISQINQLFSLKVIFPILKMTPSIIATATHLCRLTQALFTASRSELSMPCVLKVLIAICCVVGFTSALKQPNFRLVTSKRVKTQIWRLIALDKSTAKKARISMLIKVSLKHFRCNFFKKIIKRFAFELRTNYLHFC